MTLVGCPDEKAATLLVAVHGLTSAAETFAIVASRLVEQCPNLLCILIDLPGHGSKRFPSEAAAALRQSTFTNEEFAEAIVCDVERLAGSVVRREGVKVHLLAHSMGSRPCLCLAATPSFQRRLPVTSLILEDPVHFFAVPADMPRALRRAVEQEEIFNSMLFDSIQDAVTQLIAAGLQMEPDSLPRKLEEFQPGKFRLRYSLGVSVLWQAAAMEDPADEWLWDLPIPVFFIMADDRFSTIPTDDWDQLVPKNNEEGVGRRQVVRIAGAAHTVHRSHLDKFVQLMCEWMH